jgi:hypothetical protein
MHTKVLNRVTTIVGGPEVTNIDIEYILGVDAVIMKGVIGINGGPYQTNVGALLPEERFSRLLSREISKVGINIDRVSTQQCPDLTGWTKIATIPSPALSQLQTNCLQYSINIYAETFLKTLGKLKFGFDMLKE